MRGLTESPVYISVSGKYGFTWKHPQGSTELDRLDDFFHHHSMGMKFRAMSSLPGPVSPQIKRRKAPENRRAPNYSRKRLKTWDGEPLLRPGSLEWYEYQLRNPLVVACPHHMQGQVRPNPRHERRCGSKNTHQIAYMITYGEHVALNSLQFAAQRQKHGAKVSPG